MRILVTGATGVVGRRLVPLLVKEGRQVTAVGRNVGRLAALARSGAATLALDLFDRAAVRRALGGHDAVVNLATHLPAGAVRMMLPGAWRENDRIRREGSALLVDEALAVGVPRFIQESFAPVYADGGARWLDETTPLQPGRNNRSVVDAERSAARFTERGGTGIVLRFAGFYGPDSRVHLDMLPMVRRGMSPLPGRPDAWWSSISHDDAATAAAAALADALGVDAPKPMPRWLARLMGSTGEVLSRSQRISNAKLRATGWAPRWRSAREGLHAAFAPTGEHFAAAELRASPGR